MILMMNAHIKFEGFELYSVESVRIESSWENLTDRAYLVLPRSLHFRSSIEEYFSVGDKIEIHLGYDGMYRKEFSGYISKISAESPITLECEDKMYELKKININKNYTKANLRKVIEDIIPKEIKTEVADIELGGLICSRTTVAKVLQDLKEKFKIYSYFKDDVLVVGKIYTDDNETVNYELEKNVVSNSLQFRKKEDLELKVIAKSYSSNGKVIEASFGDKGAPETETIFYNIGSIVELKKLAQMDYEKMKIEGYSGEITTFGIPFVRHGYKSNITSMIYPERNGVYWVDAVTTEFSSNGFRRSVKIGRRAS